MTDENIETPNGARVVWAGLRPAEEGVPLRLPGVVVRELPEGQTLVAWADRAGFQCPDAVYDAKWLEPVADDEFERLLVELRGSGWGGLPPRAPFLEPSELPLLRVGAAVRWVGPLEGDLAWETDAWCAWYPDALGGMLTPSHPGTVSALDYRGDPLVRWIDKEGEFEGRVGVARTFLVEIDADEARSRAEQLRASEWSGLSSTAR